MKYTINKTQNVNSMVTIIRLEPIRAKALFQNFIGVNRRYSFISGFLGADRCSQRSKLEPMVHPWAVEGGGRRAFFFFFFYNT